MRTQGAGKHGCPIVLVSDLHLIGWKIRRSFLDQSEQVRKKSNENWDYFRQSIELFLIAKHILEDEVVIFKKQKTELFTVNIYSVWRGIFFTSF